MEREEDAWNSHNRYSFLEHYKCHVLQYSVVSYVLHIICSHLSKTEVGQIVNSQKMVSSYSINYPIHEFLKVTG